MRGELGNGAHFEHCDVRDVKALQASIRRASDAIGPIGVLVNNATQMTGIQSIGSRPSTGASVLPPISIISSLPRRRCCPTWSRLGGGSIINMGSTSYLTSGDSFAAYKTAKSAVYRPDAGAGA